MLQDDRLQASAILADQLTDDQRPGQWQCRGRGFDSLSSPPKKSIGCRFTSDRCAAYDAGRLRARPPPSVGLLLHSVRAAVRGSERVNARVSTRLSAGDFSVNSAPHNPCGGPWFPHRRVSPREPADQRLTPPSITTQKATRGRRDSRCSNLNHEKSRQHPRDAGSNYG